MRDKIIVGSILFIFLIMNIFCIGRIGKIEKKLRLQNEEKIMQTMDSKVDSLMKFIEENIGKLNEQLDMSNKNIQYVKDTLILHEEGMATQNKQNNDLFKKIEDTIKSQDERITGLENRNKMTEAAGNRNLEKKK